jgi:DNA-binding NarL/FixJ family response regulator
MAELVAVVVDSQPVFAEALASAVRVRLVADVDVWPLQRSFSDASGPTPDILIIDPVDDAGFHTELVEMGIMSWPQARVVVVTGHSEEDAIVATLRAGAHGFLLKSEEMETLLLGIQLVSRGSLAFSSQAARSVFARSQEILHSRPTRKPSRRDVTPREAEVVHLIAEGRVDAEIATILGISVRTVQRHVGNVLNKLGCHTRSEAVARVMEASGSFRRRAG